MLEEHTILVDFGRFLGPCLTIHPHERDVIWQGAQAMCERYAPPEDHTLREVREHIRARLCHDARQGWITAEWASSALLVMALDGIMDGIPPAILTPG